MERKRDILTMLSTDPIAAAAQAVNQIETILGCVLELIDDVNVKMHPCGIYRHPAQRLADLQAAKDMLNRAIILHMATRWPTPADYDAAGEGP
jgi:hypothetical protein